MYLSEIFDQLVYGELFHLELGNAEDHEIDTSNYPAIIANLNLALTALHGRFSLKTSELILDQYDHIQEYTLHSKFAQSNIESEEPIKYIADSIYKPFKDDLLKIEQVFDEGGSELRINDENDTLSVFTSSFNTIQIPYAMSGNSTAIVYRANHDKIVLSNTFNPHKIEIDIPWHLLEPLLFYMAHRFYAVNGMQGSGQDSINYLNKYQASCTRIEMNGLINRTDPSNIQFEAMGWK